MADKQATPDVVGKKRASEIGRKVMVGTFSNYAGPIDEKSDNDIAYQGRMAQ